MPLSPPTDAEIEAAAAAITADGPGAESTMLIAVAVHCNPILQAMVRRIRTVSALDEGALYGILMLGLNYGIRIGEARANAKTKTH